MGAEEERPLVLCVSRNRQNLKLLGDLIRREGYEALPAADLGELDRVLSGPRAGEVRLALVDLGGFDRTIWERCEELRARSIPFLIISPHQSPRLHQASLEHGARGVLAKPVVARQLLDLIKTMIGGEGSGPNHPPHTT